MNFVVMQIQTNCLIDFLIQAFMCSMIDNRDHYFNTAQLNSEGS